MAAVLVHAGPRAGIPPGQRGCRHNSGRVRASQPSRDTPRPLELAGGGYWWLGARKDVTLVFGDQFVLQRPRVGGEGLVPSPQASVQVYRPPAAAPAVRPRQPVVLALPGQLVIDTEYELLESSSYSPPQQWGIVHVGSVGGVTTQDAGPARGKHPRRTRRLRFTCNLCCTVNEKEVNPHAWAQGSVFCRCEGCTVVHKLKDNLKVRGNICNLNCVLNNGLMNELMNELCFDLD